MNREFRRVGVSRQAFLLLGLCVACNGGRSDIDEEESEGLGGAPNVSGGATSQSLPKPASGGSYVTRGGSSWSTASGGYWYSGGYATGGSRFAGGSGGTRATGGSSAIRLTGGSGGVGGRTAGGAGGLGGVSGIAGTPRNGGAGGVAGTRSINGGTSGIAGRSSLGGTSGNSGSGGTSLTSVAGQPGSGGSSLATGGAAGASGIGGASGGGGASGAAGCNPVRVGAPSTAGAAGVDGGAGTEWYVDAQNGSDQSPGTQSQPLKTLSCAAQAAHAGDSVKLLDGTWDGTTDPVLNNTAAIDCGTGAGVSFASNVSLSAVNPGSARINSNGSHGVCMSGGALEGVRFGCYQTAPVIESREGTLTIVGCSFKQCGGVGIAVSGTADVTVRPGNLSDYSELPNAYFASASEQSHLTVDGGKLTFGAYGILAKDEATVTAHGVTFTGKSDNYAGYALSLDAGAPTVTINGGSKIEYTSIGVSAADFHGKLVMDDVTISNGGNAVQLYQSANNALLGTVNLSQLNVTDLGGFGVTVSGNIDVSVKNSSFAQIMSPTLMVSGSGTASFDTVVVSNCWSGLDISGDSLGYGRTVKARGLQVTGSSAYGVRVTSTSQDTFDFGKVSDPGNNVFRANNHSAEPDYANFVFGVASTIYAVGNTWDANAQGADANGKYSASVGALETATGLGPNFYATSENTGKLRLAESP